MPSDRFAERPVGTLAHVVADVAGDQYRVRRRHPAAERVREYAAEGLRCVDAVDRARWIRKQVRIRHLQ